MFNGDALREAREEKGLTQVELANLLGVTARAVAYWEAGERQPRGYVARQIARVLDKPLDYFVGDDA